MVYRCKNLLATALSGVAVVAKVRGAGGKGARMNECIRDAASGLWRAVARLVILASAETEGPQDVTHLPQPGRNSERTLDAEEATGDQR